MRINWWRVVVLAAVTAAAGTGAWLVFARPSHDTQPASARETSGPVQVEIPAPSLSAEPAPSIEPSPSAAPVVAATTTRRTTPATPKSRHATPRPSARPAPTRTPSIGHLPGMGAGTDMCEQGRCPGQ